MLALPHSSDSQSGEHVAIVGDQSFYILRLNTEVVEAALAAGGSADADGIDDAFELLNEVRVQGQGGESGLA